MEHSGDEAWGLVTLIETIEPGTAVIYCCACNNIEIIPVHYDIADVFLEEFFWICNICKSFRCYPKMKVSNMGRSIYTF